MSLLQFQHVIPIRAYSPYASLLYCLKIDPFLCIKALYVKKILASQGGNGKHNELSNNPIGQQDPQHSGRKNPSTDTIMAAAKEAPLGLAVSVVRQGGDNGESIQSGHSPSAAELNRLPVNHEDWA